MFSLTRTWIYGCIQAVTDINVATSFQSEKQHQGSLRGVMEDEPILIDNIVEENNKLETDIDFGTLDLDRMYTCICGRQFKSERGKKIHATKMNCNQNTPHTNKPNTAKNAKLHVYICGKQFEKDRGLKIHQTKKRCASKALGDRSESSQKTEGNQAQVDNHSSKINPPN